MELHLNASVAAIVSHTSAPPPPPSLAAARRWDSVPPPKARADTGPTGEELLEWPPPPLERVALRERSLVLHRAMTDACAHAPPPKAAATTLRSRLAAWQAGGWPRWDTEPCGNGK